MCSVEPNSNLWIHKPKIKIYGNYNALGLRSSTHQNSCTCFLLLQTVGTWHVLLHTPNSFENNYECVAATYASPVGNVVLVTVEVYAIRYVQNSHCFFHYSLLRLKEIMLKMEFLLTELYGQKMMWCYIAV